MKAFTDIEQSKKLAKILPLESADMCYIPSAEDDEGNTLYTADFKSEFIFGEDCIPCWSLAALLEYLEKKDRFPEINEKAKDGFIIKTYIWDGKTSIQISEGDTLVDACYELILKLYKHKLI